MRSRRARDGHATGTRRARQESRLPPVELSVVTCGPPGGAGHGSAAVRAPPRRRVLTDATVNGLSNEVGMARVAAVLLHEVAQQAPQVGMVALRVVSRDRLVEPAAREDRGQPRSGALDRTVPHGIQLLGG